MYVYLFEEVSFSSYVFFLERGKCSHCSDWVTAWMIGFSIFGRASGFYFLQNVKTSSETHPASWSVSIRDSFLGTKCEVDCAPIYTSEVKNDWICVFSLHV